MKKPTLEGLIRDAVGVRTEFAKEKIGIRVHVESFPLDAKELPPIPMILFCPNGHRHIDSGEFATRVHHTHACQECGLVWRPAIPHTVGVQFLPGFKNEK